MAIVATGSTTPANTAGISKIYVAGETITFTNPAAPSPTTQVWEVVDAPPAQASTLTGSTTSSPTLVLDADPGTFRIRHTADGVVNEILIATETADGYRIPGYRERDTQDATGTEAVWNEASNTKGWFPAMHARLKASGGGGGSTSEIWAPPASPNANDEEFTDASLPAGWTESFTPSGTIDAYDTGFTTGSPRRSINDDRPSWYMIQCPSDSNLYYTYLDLVTVPTNLLIVARCKFTYRNIAAVGNDATVGFYLAEDNGAGAPAVFGNQTINNGITIHLNEQDTGARFPEIHSMDSGSYSAFGSGPDSDQQAQAFTTVAIHKIGNTYHGWAGTDNGNWLHLGSTTITFTMRHVGLYFKNTSAVAPGQQIVGVDFLRFYETDKFIP